MGRFQAHKRGGSPLFVSREGNTGSKKALTVRERRFLRLVLRGKSYADAYAETSPRVLLDNEGRYVRGSLMMKRIRTKLGEMDWQGKLGAAEIDDIRLIEEIAAGLRAIRPEFYQGVEVAVVEDNGTRQRARELLADVLGRRKASVELGGDLGVKLYRTISPDDWNDPPATAPVGAPTEPQNPQTPAHVAEGETV